MSNNFARYPSLKDKTVFVTGGASGLGAAWDGNQFTGLQDYELGLPAGTHSPLYQWESKIGKISISPAISYKINDAFSVGAALNIDYGMFSLKRWAGAVPLTPEASLKIRKGNYERLFDAARLRVRAWEQANLK